MMKTALQYASGLLLFLLVSTVVGQSGDSIQQPNDKENAVQDPNCSLDDKALEERKNTVLRELKTKATKTEKINGGYKFTLPRQEENFRLVTSIILLESECCPFIDFQISAAAGSRDIAFLITSPADGRGLLDELFAPVAEQPATDQVSKSQSGSEGKAESEECSQ
ncbi:MAG: hypothetical protein AAGJ79_02050 [Verrucomicrobiota bacterium]